jgi:hypothetical protein
MARMSKTLALVWLCAACDFGGALDAVPPLCEWDLRNTLVNEWGGPVILRGDNEYCGPLPVDRDVCEGPVPALYVGPGETYRIVARSWQTTPCEVYAVDP